MRFRTVLGHFPTGVTIITAIDDEGPIGLTIGSFTSVSLDPSLVGFLPMADSVRWQRMLPTGAFCVNVLASTQGELCWQFARSSIEQPFDGVAWTPAPHSGAPILDGALAWMDCRMTSVTEAGDHLFVLGEVIDLDHLADRADADATNPLPLLFFRGRLGEFSQHD